MLKQQRLAQHFLSCVCTDTVFYNSEYGRGTISTTLSLLCMLHIQCSTIVSMDVALLVQHLLPSVGTDTVFYNSEYGHGTISTTLAP